MKPYFIIGGIAKNGTSYLHSLLKKHSQITMPERAMGYSFFDNDIIYKNGFDWYKSIFKNLDHTKVIGQVSADCAFNPGSMERIKKHLPDEKLIFIFRNPVDSVYSLYWHQIKMGREYRTFKNALKTSEKKSKKSYYDYKMYAYLDRYRFAEQVKNIRKYFDEDQLLFIPFEVLIKDEVKILNIVFDFLGVDNINNLSDLILNENVHKNKAKIPVNRSVVWLSYQLQELSQFTGQRIFKRAGRYILNKSLEEKRPPAMDSSMHDYLVEELSDDINFHQELVEKYKSLHNSSIK